MNDLRELSDKRMSATMRDAAGDEQPRRRVILLGASNLTRSFPIVVATALRTWGEPVEIMAAMGHGRSFGQDSAVLGRKISGIFPCALWQDLKRRASLPTAALVTDIGNDLLYGVPPDRLFDWVEKCVERLTDVGAQTVVTQMPVDSVEKLGEKRFQFYRRLFFPRSRMTLSDAQSLVRAFNARLVGFANSRKIPVIPASGAWYGFDPIHLKRGVACEAWPTLLASWRGGPAPVVVTRPSLWTASYLATLPPCEQSLLGIRRRALQPSGRLRDGTTISLY
jgi:hypothetical protein